VRLQQALHCALLANSDLMNRRVVWLSLALIGFIAGILAMLQNDSDRPNSDSLSKLDTPPATSTTPAEPFSISPASDGPAVIVQTPPIIDPETDQPLIPPLPLQTGELAWEARIRSVLSHEKATDAEKARSLLQLLPTMPAEGAETCTEEAVKRLPNDEYRHAQAFVTNPGTYGLALGVLFADLMERPDNLRLPTLATIARNATHPYAGPARDNLEFLLGQDYGSDWARWEAAVREKLASGK
jgi:hypothetical protein